MESKLFLTARAAAGRNDSQRQWTGSAQIPAAAQEDCYKVKTFALYCIVYYIKNEKKKKLAPTRDSFSFANRTLQMTEEEHHTSPAPLQGRDQTELAGSNYTKQCDAALD